MVQALKGYRGLNSGNKVTRDYSHFDGDGGQLEGSVLYRVPWQIEANRTGMLYKNIAISRVRAHQPDGWDVTDPPTIPANNIHALACEALGIEDYKNMRLYTALGSSLDFNHGCDAFLEFIDPELGDSQIITLDITRNPMKYLKGHKADVIVFGHHADVAANDIAALMEKKRYQAAVA